MDNIQPSNAVNFKGIENIPRRQEQQTQPVSAPVQKKDGTKLMFASLTALAAIGGGVYLIKSGKGKQAVDGIKKAFSKNADEVQEVVPNKLLDKIKGSTTAEINQINDATKKGLKNLQGQLKKENAVLANLETQIKNLGDNPPADKFSELTQKIDQQKAKILKFENSITKNEEILSAVQQELGQRPILRYTDSKTGQVIRDYAADSDDLMLLKRNRSAASELIEANKTKIDELTGQINKLSENSTEAIPLKAKQDILTDQVEKLQKGLDDAKTGTNNTLQDALSDIKLTKQKEQYGFGINKAQEKIDSLNKTKDLINEQLKNLTGNLSQEQVKLQADLLKQQSDITASINKYKSAIQNLNNKL